MLRRALSRGLLPGLASSAAALFSRRGDYVFGTATATSIWLTGAVGAAVAYDRYEIAIALGLIDFVVLKLLTPIKQKMEGPGAQPGEDTDEENADAE